MTTVFLDGEAVEFSGPAPGDLNEVQKILSDYLLSNSQVLLQFKVDGRDLLETPISERPNSYETIEAMSVSQSIAIGQLLEETFEMHGTLAQRMQETATDLLLHSWDETHQKLSNDVAELATLFELLSNVILFGDSQGKLAESWLKDAKDILDQFQKNIDLLAQAFEAKDIGYSSELLSEILAPLITQCFDCMQQCLETSTQSLSNN